MSDGEMTHLAGGSEASDEEPERQRHQRGEGKDMGRSDKGDDADEDSLSESAELTCCACGIKSNEDDQVSVKKVAMAKGKGVIKLTKVIWGKTSTRKLKTRSGRVFRKKRSSGEWCRLCLNNCRRNLTKTRSTPRL